MAAVLAGNTECPAASDKDAGRTCSLEFSYHEDRRPSPARESLHELVRAGDVDKLKNALRHGAKMNAIDKDGFTPLMLAARLHRGEMMQLLIEAGADTRAGDRNGNSALMLALLRFEADKNREACKVDEAWERQMIPFIKKLGKEAACAKNDSEQTVLMCAAASGATGCVTALAELGADVNAVDFQGRTALMCAAASGSADCVTALVKLGVDVNAADSHGSTALRYAIDDENAETAQALIKAGASIDDDFLHSATERGNVRIARLLTEAGAAMRAKAEQGRTALMSLLQNIWKPIDENHIEELPSFVRLSGRSVVAERDEIGRTALMYAADRGLTECAAALMELGANVNERDGGGRTVLMHAAGGGEDKVGIKYLLNAGAELNAKDAKGRTALMHAAAAGNEQIVQELLEAGADINAQNRHGRTALMYAVLKAHESIACELLAAGADALAQDDNGCTALMFAAHKDLQECAAELIKLGANVNGRDARGRTVLMYAAAQRHDDGGGIEYLLDAGAEVNATDAGGHTALMYAAAARNSEMAAELLDAEADAGIKDGKGRTALMYLCLNGTDSPDMTAVLKLLLQSGAELNARDNAGLTPLAYAIRNTNTEWVNLLLEEGADVNVQDIRGRTTLMLAAQAQTDPSALLNAGAEVNAQDREGRTALMYAVKQRGYIEDEESVISLLDAGATVDARDIYGRTALMYASWYPDTPEIIDTLLEAGADSRLKDNKGYTAAQPPPLMAAMRARDWNAVKQLVKNGVKFPDKDATEIILLMMETTRAYDNEIVELLLQAGKYIDAWSAAESLKNVFDFWYDGEPIPFQEQLGSRIDIAAFTSFLRHSCYHDADIRRGVPYIELDTTGICRSLSDGAGLELTIDIPDSEHMTYNGSVVTPSAGADVDFLCAAIENDMAAAQRALQNGVHADMPVFHDYSLLTWVALCGNAECVKLLLNTPFSAGKAIVSPHLQEAVTSTEIRDLLMAAAAQETDGYAPDSLAGKSLVMDYTDAQFCGRDSIGKAVSEKVWVPLAQAASLPGIGLSPKATRHLFPLNDDGKGTYNYSKTSGCTGRLSVKPENGESFTARFYELTFTSPTGGTAVETQYKEDNRAKKGSGEQYKTYCETRRIRFSVKNE